jgi:hypothetical protein
MAWKAIYLHQATKFRTSLRVMQGMVAESNFGFARTVIGFPQGAQIYLHGRSHA